ncbi:MAG TPA: hypothetical protein DFR83_01765 [Deltaproteobacteria bacterium]|nr:hypothetical protein [Deltaproteobacteria bacterium]
MWTVETPEDRTALANLLNTGQVLALDIDPRGPVVALAPRQPGLGSALVGQRVIFRQWLGTTSDAPISSEELDGVLRSVLRWLDGPEATASLNQISSGYRCERLWSGDELGEWSADAWQAAQHIVAGIVHAMESTSAE